MSAFLDAILAFPTVVFTVMVVLFLLYATATILGALDLEWLDGLLGVDHVEDTVLEGALSFFGVAGVPITIFGGIASILAWVTSIAATKILPNMVTLDVIVLIASGIIGLALGGVLARPLRGFFNMPPAPQRKQIVGKICTIRSLKVDGACGTAEVADGGSGFIAEVRCFRDNQLTRGSKAIVYDYDHQQGIYHVGPIDPSIADLA